jgi:hypothetical protein
VQGKAWYSYVDADASLDQLKKLTSEFLAIFDKCPSKLKKKILQSHNEVGFKTLSGSVADPGCLSRIQSQKDSRIRFKENLSILTPKNCFYALSDMIWDVHPGCRSLFFFTDPGPRIQRLKGTGSRIRIRIKENLSFLAQKIVYKLSEI